MKGSDFKFRIKKTSRFLLRSVRCLLLLKHLEFTDGKFMFFYALVRSTFLIDGSGASPKLWISEANNVKID